MYLFQPKVVGKCLTLPAKIFSVASLYAQSGAGWIVLQFSRLSICGLCCSRRNYVIVLALAMREVETVVNRYDRALHAVFRRVVAGNDVGLDYKEMVSRYMP